MSKNHTWSDFKKRIVDILEATGLDAKQDKVRMWLSTEDADLVKSLKAITEAGPPEK